MVAGFVSVGLWKTWINQALPLIVGPRVLEVGHGPGHLQAKICDAGLESYGLDSSRQMGIIAQRKIKSAKRKLPDNRYGYAHFPLLVRGISQSIPFPAANFDSILATFPTEYIFDPATLQEIYRILVPGGRLVILLGAWITGRRWYERAAASLFRVTGQAPKWNSAWSQPLKDAGFVVSEIQQHLPSSLLLFLVAEKRQIASPAR